MKDKQTNIVSIRLDDETLQKLKDDAQKEYRPLAMHLRKILVDYLARNGKTSSGDLKNGLPG